jgi:hypothetical protein
MHKGQDTLCVELEAAAKLVKVGGEYSHYKNPQQTYKVLHLAFTEWDDKVCVIYQAQYGENVIFVRPLDSWLEKVEWQGQLVDRFSAVPTSTSSHS